MINLKEAVIVEGKYDKIKLSSVIKGLIIETNGFRIFKDKRKLNLIRKLAITQGIIILTDSDSAGFLIRNYLNCSINKGTVLHAYIPDIIGKEKRKMRFSKEGKLGVEGMDIGVIEKVINKSGAMRVLDRDKKNIRKNYIRMKLYDYGFYGRKFSKEKRKELKDRLNFPGYLSTNALIDIMAGYFSERQIDNILKDINN